MPSVVLIINIVQDPFPVRIHRAQNAVVEIHGAILPHQTQMVRWEAGEPVNEGPVFTVVILEERHRAMRPGDHLVDVERMRSLEQGVALRRGQALVSTPPGIAPVP